MHKKFNKLHSYIYLKFTTIHILFNFLVFVIWNINTEGKKKDETLLNICKLIKIVLPNSDFLTLQLEIMANVRVWISFIFFDAISIFYQCLPHP